MSTLRNTIEALASQFAASVLDALRGASLDELAGVAGAGGVRGATAARRGPGRPRSDASASSAAASTGAAKGRRRAGRLGRRSAGDITRMVESIVDALSKSATGMRAEQLRESLGVEAKELPRPLAEALSSGRVTKTGQKRATTYFAGSGGAAGAPKRRGRPAGRKNKKR
ncbi:MAG: hypothetical protein JWP87_5802 [Labilithrix sp.]|nr:hypothetical protein [Labilithrix sp.]